MLLLALGCAETPVPTPDSPPAPVAAPADPPQDDHQGHDHHNGDHDHNGDQQGDGNHNSRDGHNNKPKATLAGPATVADPSLGQTPYPLSLPSWMEPPPMPADNPLTHAGVDLGRHLFYDPLLSGNNTQACAGCHRQSLSFTDGRQFSVGAEGRPATRNAMALVNLAWSAPYFWDGRAETLEALVPIPIQHPDEMNQSLPALMVELQQHPDYPARFENAFPGEGITEATVSKAMAQFLRSLVSFRSRADRLDAGEITLTALEVRGNELMVDGLPKDAPDRVQDICDACHKHSAGVIGAASEMGLFTTAEYKTNGLVTGDLGRLASTGDEADRGTFKIPTIRNLTVTAPYMHDGRFADLDAVVDHYNTGIAAIPGLEAPLGKDGKPQKMLLNDDDKAAIVAILGIFTDDEFLVDPAFSDPFQTDHEH